ncbi:hypothetical protein [Microbacterium sp. XT11]|uniref:hypothetical protein n=1 Tax=Microbacterium sp. XT11 TaxID=367477 RepID=UPI000AE615E2|nr:hypothetical protein [Microbacterium sp. XT11]
MTNESLTWEDAKRDTQAMETEIATRIPSDAVVTVTQNPTGVLFSCDQDKHRWMGKTTVVVTPGTEVESVVRGLEDRYRGGRFEVSTRTDIGGFYEVHLKSPQTAEGYIISEGDSRTIWIHSSSPCFTLPDDVYPGGKF